ncbi:MAG: DUF6781 family protein [Methylocella sp.]
MHSETGKNSESAGHGDPKLLEADVRRAVEQGEDIQENVRRLTLMALGGHPLDLETLRRTMSAVVDGARDGIQQQMQETTAQAQMSRAKMGEAVAGLDSALAQFAEASKLAMEEATGQARKFSDEELVRTRDGLEGLERLFLDTLQGSASTANGQVGDALRDLAKHMERNGTAVGGQIKDALETVGRQITTVGLIPFESGIRLAVASSDLMRKIAAGVITAVIDPVKPDHNSPKKSDD